MVVVETSGTQGTSEPRDGDDADSLSDVALRQDEEDVQVYFFLLYAVFRTYQGRERQPGNLVL